MARHATSANRNSSSTSYARTSVSEEPPSLVAGGVHQQQQQQQQSAASWLKESILGIPRRLIGVTSNTTQEQPPKQQQQEVGTELKVVGDEDWCILRQQDIQADIQDNVSSNGMSSTTVAAAASSSESHDGGVSGLTPNSYRKRVGSNKMSHHLSASTPPLGPRTSSVGKSSKSSSKLSGGSSSSTSSSSSSSQAALPASPSSSIQRKSSGRSSRSTLEVQNGGAAAQRSVSPSRTRHHSPPPPKGGVGGARTSSSNITGSFRGKRRGILVNDSNHHPPSSSSHGSDSPTPSSSSSNNNRGMTSSPQLDSRPSENTATPATTSVSSNSSGGIMKKPPPHPVLTNGLASTSSSKVPDIDVKLANEKKGESAGAVDESVSSPSAFERVRDTLQISRPKKKKKKGKLAYSIVVDPVPSTPELNLNGSEMKYRDPFETSYAESDGESSSGQKTDHDFKPASIPHNKPEYCDHCGDMAWGLYRQVLKCSKCNFIAHRKCESKVMIGCASRLEQAILHHDKQVEDVERLAAREEAEKKGKEKEPAAPVEAPSTPTSSVSSHTSSAPPSNPPTSPTSTTAPSITSSGYSLSTTATPASSQVLMEKTKLSRKIREYNRKTTPVHHIHIKSSHQSSDPNSFEYHGFVRVHMNVQRPIHVSTAITRTSWYRLMRPVKERTLNDVDGYDIQTAFYLPLDTNRLVHIQNTTTTKELIQILLKKFCVTDNPKKFSLYEDYGGDCRRLFEEDRPLEISVDASVSHRNSKLVLRDNTYSTIQWDAFSVPELGNFIQILQREEELYMLKMKDRFQLWRDCIQQTLKEKCMEEQAKKTKKTVNSRLGVGSRTKKSPSSPKSLKKSSDSRGSTKVSKT